MTEPFTRSIVWVVVLEITETAAARPGPKFAAQYRSGLRPALALLLVIGIFGAAGQMVLVAGSDPVAGWIPGIQTIVGMVYLAVGALAWDRRPSNRTGLLLVVAGIAHLAATFVNVASAPLYLLGFLAAQAPIATVIHLLLAFPSGRLAGRADRALTTTGYVVFVGLQVPQYWWGGAALPINALVFADRPDLAELGHDLQPILGIPLLLVTAVVLALRYRSSRKLIGQRRSRAAVYSYGLAAVLFLPISARILRHILNWSALTLFVAQLVALVVVPFVVATALLRGGFARSGRIEELGAWLGSSESARIPIREALAGTLGDHSLQLLFRHGDSGELLDSTGRRTERPVGPATGTIGVEVRGAESAIIVYDSGLVADPALVESAGRVVALALEREKLTAELLASREAVRESRARIAEIGDIERRRFAHDLHDVLQSRLVLAALQAGTLAVGVPDICCLCCCSRLNNTFTASRSSAR